MATAYLIWLVTFGSGVRTGMIAMKTPGCCGVVIGAIALLATCGYLTATATLRVMGTIATGFDAVCQDRINYF